MKKQKHTYKSMKVNRHLRYCHTTHQVQVKHVKPNSTSHYPPLPLPHSLLGLRGFSCDISTFLMPCQGGTVYAHISLDQSTPGHYILSNKHSNMLFKVSVKNQYNRGSETFYPLNPGVTFHCTP